MKIHHIDQKKREIVVTPENLNDLWTLYNIIREGDEVSAQTQRRIVLKEGSKGERKRMRLKLKTETIAFHEFSNRLRVKGKILEGPEDFVSFGTYHTFNIEPFQKINIVKDSWSKHDLRRLKERSKFESNFIILIAAIETGLATIAIITNFSHNRIATIKKHIPGKRYKQTYRNQALNEFYEDIGKVVLENLNTLKVDLIILSGPGNTKNYFMEYLKKILNSSQNVKIQLCHASSGTESAIIETLKSEELATLKKQIKILQETEMIEKILTQFSLNADLIRIGLDEAFEASERGAIEQLLIADIMIRGASKEKKLKIETVITNVENSGGTINIMNTENIAGEQLVNLGSIIGILRYNLQ